MDSESTDRFVPKDFPSIPGIASKTETISMQDLLRNLLAPSSIYAIYSNLELLNAVLEKTLDHNQLKQH